MAKRPPRGDDKPQSITEKKVLLVEGPDEEKFFYYMFRDKGIKTVQVISFDGKDNLRNKIEDLKGIDGYNEVNAILILRDSDKSAKSASQSVNSVLKSTGLIDRDTDPFTINEFNAKKIGFMLSPGYNENGQLSETGALEDLCQKIFKEQSVLQQIDVYFEDFLKDRRLKREHKNRLHTAFSFTDDYVGMKIGETANAKGFDYESPYFAPFLDIIKRIAE